MSADPRIGSEMFGYRIERVLESGQARESLLALDPDGRGRVVIKVVDTDRDDDSRRARIQQVSNELRDPNHDSIVPVRELHVEQERLIVVRDWVDGDDLAAVCAKPETLSLDARIELVSQAARGLDAARWGHGLAHGNLKPQNIIVTSDTGSAGIGRVCLLDFGLWAPADAASLADGSPTKNAAYTAPEVLRGEEPGSASDQYALARILSEYRLELPPGVTRVVERAREERPEGRFASCTEFAAALRAASSEPGPDRESGVQLVADEPRAESSEQHALALDRTDSPATNVGGEPEPAVEASLGGGRRAALLASAALAAVAAVVVAVLVFAGDDSPSGGTELSAGEAELRAGAGPVDAAPGGETRDLVRVFEWTRGGVSSGGLGDADHGRVHSVTVGPRGLVAVGDSTFDAAVWVSEDGLEWARVNDVNGALGGGGERLQRLRDVTVGGPGLVAVGFEEAPNSGWSAAVWTSADGVIWSRSGVPDDDAAFGDERSYEMWGVTAGGPGLVAVGSGGLAGRDAAVWTSVDGLTWSPLPTDELSAGGSGGFQSMADVVAGGPGFVAVGRDGLRAAAWISPDGLNWSRVSPEEATTVFGAPDGKGARMNGVAVGGPGLVAVGQSGTDAAVWTSVGGAEWVRIPHDDGTLGGELDQEMQGVVAEGSGLMAVGRDGASAAVWTSVDGITWSRVERGAVLLAGPGSQEINDAVATGAGVVAVGSERTQSGGFAAAAWAAR